MTLMTPLAAEFAASAVFTPTVGSTINKPPVGDVLTTVPDTPADRNATTWVGLLSGTDIGPVIEILACIGGFPAAPGVTAVALTRRLVMRNMRVPVPGGSRGTLMKVTLLGAVGVS